METAVRFNTPGPKRLTGARLDSYLREVVGVPEPFAGNHDVVCDRSVTDLAHKRGAWGLGCYITTKTSDFTEKELGAIKSVVESIRERGGRVLPEDGTTIAGLHRRNKATNAPALLSIFTSPHVVMMYRIHKVGARSAGDIPTWRVLGFKTLGNGLRCLRPVDVDVDEFSRKVFGVGIDSLRHEIVGVSNMLVATKICNGLIFSTEVQPMMPAFPKVRDIATEVAAQRVNNPPKHSEQSIQTTHPTAVMEETPTEPKSTNCPPKDAWTQTELPPTSDPNIQTNFQLDATTADLQKGIQIKIANNLSLSIKLVEEVEVPNTNVHEKQLLSELQMGEDNAPAKTDSTKSQSNPQAQPKKKKQPQKQQPSRKKDKPTEQPKKKTLDLYGKGEPKTTHLDPLVEKRGMYVVDSRSQRTINKIWVRRAVDAMSTRLPKNQQLVWLNLPLCLADQSIATNRSAAEMNDNK